MRRRVENHKDGSWRMDFHTFCEIPAQRIITYMETKPIPRARRTKKVRHLVAP